MTSVQKYRAAALRDLTDEIGVYALCDLDGVPIYVGQSVDGIRSRVRRHLTSARSDIIANRQVDVWEIAFVWGWPVAARDDIEPLERHLFCKFDEHSTLMNGRALAPVAGDVEEPERQVVQVIDEDERKRRLVPSQRLPRQILQYQLLVDYLLQVKEADHLKRSLDAHFDRLDKFHRTFL